MSAEHPHLPSDVEAITTPERAPTRARGVGDQDAPPQLHIGGIRNRFLIDGSDTGGRFSVVHHLFEPRAGRPHAHTRE